MDVGGWKASIHTLCLPVSLHHAQNVNHSSPHFLTSLVWLHEQLPYFICKNNKLGWISEAACLSSTNPATQSAAFLLGAITRAALWPNQFFFIYQSPDWNGDRALMMAKKGEKCLLGNALQTAAVNLSTAKARHLTDYKFIWTEEQCGSSRI